MQFSLLALLIVCALAVRAQQPAPKPPPTPTAAPPQRAAPPAPAPPQIVTVVHRLNGIKLIRWLNRQGTPVTAVVEYDDANPLAGDMHTSITAGFALNDGHSIIASLPQAEAEVLAPPAAPHAPEARGTKTDKTPVAQVPDLMVMRGDGFKFAADYVGLDGLTGLSLLRIDGLDLPSIPDALEETLAVGQRVRLYAPAPAIQNETGPLTNLYLRMGEIEGKLANIARTSAGRVAHLTVSAPNLSPAINGGVALNDAGETVGIVEASSKTEARILPAQVVRRAAERVMARRASVPRPLLGVRGKAVTAASLFQFTSSGWSKAEATALMGQGQGLLLTAVAPRSPAALADLRPGDIIVRINETDVKNAEDFSFMLSEASDDAPVLFTILRGQTPVASVPPPPSFPSLPPAAEAAPPAPIADIPPIKLEPFNLPKPLKPLKPIAVSVKLNFSFKMDTLMQNFPTVWPDFPTAWPAPTAPLSARGIETIPLATAAPAARRGARRGVLVVAVSPASQGQRAGLREGDIIETINGKQLTSTAQTRTLLSSDASLSLSVIRNGQKLTIKLPGKETKVK
jgi:S1-C subfamily serine protease